MDRRIATSLFETFAPPEADAVHGIENLIVAFGVIPAHRRAKLEPFLKLLGTIGFPHWPLGVREGFLRMLADAPVSDLRTAFQALKRLTLNVAYTSMDERGGNPLWARLGYEGPRADRRPPERSVPSIIGATGMIKADAVVIGSGAGGGVAAALLARAGLQVAVLEAGPPYEEITATQSEALASALYLENGALATDDLSVAILAGSCVGGGTTINWSTSLRLKAEVAAQWEAASGVASLGSDLQASYNAVHERLGLVASPKHNRNNAVIMDGCAKLGWEATAQLRNASVDCGEGCGYCGFGCAYGNKRGTAVTYLRDAVAAGARIYANTPVERIRTENGRVVGVDAGALRVDAPLVFVAAGSLRTPGVLARSGVQSPHLGRHLKLHPVVTLGAEFDTPVEAWTGPIQTALCDRFANLADAYGAVIEVAPAHPGIIGSATPWRSRAQHAADMARWRNSASLIILTRDRGEGSISLDGRDDVHYELAAEDADRMFTVLGHAAEMAFAAGAKRISTGHTVPIELTREAFDRGELPQFVATVRKRGTAPNRVLLFSAHQMGTARMSADPAGGVVDGSGRVHGMEGLYVSDASVFPLASGVNPMLTIMALAHRTTSAYLASNEKKIASRALPDPL